MISHSVSLFQYALYLIKTMISSKQLELPFFSVRKCLSYLDPPTYKQMISHSVSLFQYALYLIKTMISSKQLELPFFSVRKCLSYLNPLTYKQMISHSLKETTKPNDLKRYSPPGWHLEAVTSHFH